MTGSHFTTLTWSLIEYDDNTHTINHRFDPPTFAFNQLMEFPLQYYSALTKGIILEWLIDPPNEQYLKKPLSPQQRYKLFQQIKLHNYFPDVMY